MDSKTAPSFTHLISDERWGETCLIENLDDFLVSMEDAMFTADVAATKLAELQEIAAERDEECEETFESIAQAWRDQLLDACQDVEPVTLLDGRIGWMTSDESVYVETANGLASYVGELSDLTSDD